jgi:hypothetical protein
MTFPTKVCVASLQVRAQCLQVSEGLEPLGSSKEKTMANAFEQSHSLFVNQAAGTIRQTVQYDEYEMSATLSGLLVSIEVLKEEKERLFKLIAELLYKNQILRQTSLCASSDARPADNVF